MDKDLPFSCVPIDAVRSYWNRRPCNIRHSTSEVGSRQYFDEVEARKYTVESHIPAFAQFERWKGKRVLEIGCGIGTDTMRFARAGAVVTSVDLSEESLALARKRADVYGVKVQFYQANAEELSRVVPIDCYDLVYSFGVLHHTPNPARAIGELKQYMDADSVFKMMVYHRNCTKVAGLLLSQGKGAFWNLDALIARHSEAQTGCPVTYSYTRKSVRQLLDGFDIDSIQVDHIFPYRISDYLDHRYRKVWQYRCLPHPVFHGLERLWGWHLCVTSRPKSALPNREGLMRAA